MDWSKPITLERDNLLEGGLDSIVKDYSVTDKADGEKNDVIYKFGWIRTLLITIWMLNPLF